MTALWVWLSTPQALAAGVWLLGFGFVFECLYIVVRDVTRAVRARSARIREARLTRPAWSREA